MRCNQVSIFIERFGEYVPKGYPADVQRISVYCDDFESVYAALAKANAMAINELNQHESIGVRSYVSTNGYSLADYREMHGHDPIDSHAYEDDLELMFTYKDGELRKDRIWVHENIDEIIKLIKTVEDKNVLNIELKEKFGLKDFQIKKLLSMRLDMFSKEDYLDDLDRDNEYELFEKNRKDGWSLAQQIHWCERRVRESKKKVNEYKAYIVIAENYKDIIDIVSNNPDFWGYQKILEEKYGLDRDQAKLVKMVTISDLLSVDKYRDELKKAEEDLSGNNEHLKEMLEKQAAEKIDE